MTIRENMSDPKDEPAQAGAISPAITERLGASLLGKRMLDWLEQRSTRKLSVHTVARYANDHERILDQLAISTGKPRTEIDLADLTRQHIRSAFARYANTGGMGPDGRSHSTVAGTITTWNLFLDHLVLERALEANPMTGVVERPTLTKGTPKALTSPTETLGRLFVSAARGDREPGRWGAWPARDVALLALIATTAIRRAEAIGVRVQDLEQSTAGWQMKVFGKGRKERWVPVDDFAAELVQKYLAERTEKFPKQLDRKGRLPDTAPLLVGDRGDKLTATQAWTIVDECFKAAGVRGKAPAGALVHALRHTKATLMAKNGASATDIQELLGHESLATSQLYVKADPDRVRTAAMGSGDVGALRAALSPPAEKESP